MAKSRMAGDKINEDKNFAARQAIANDPERLKERLGRVDRDQFDLSGYSDKEINMALQGDKFDENDYKRLTGKSVEPDKGEDDIGIPTPTPTPETTPEPEYTIQPAPEKEKPNIYFPGPVGPGGSQNVNQDNDINTNINGNDNEVTNTVDNSIRQYGGSSHKAQLGATDLMDNYVLNLRKSRQAG